MNIYEEVLAVPVAGITRPVTVCHITDMHLCECDGRNEARLAEHARNRDNMFSNGHPGALVAAFREMVARSQDADAIIMTGDIMDFPSEANLDVMGETLKQSRVPCLYNFGNHDYSAYIFEPESVPVRERNKPKMMRALPNDPVYARLDVGEMRFVALDDSLYRIAPEQVDALRKDLGAGKPTVLCMHIPLYAETLYEPTCNFWRAPILTAVPAEKCGGRTEYAPDEATAAAVSLLKGSGNLAAVLAGHLHFAHDDVLFNGVTQFTGSNGAMGAMRRIRFIPEK